MSENASCAMKFLLRGDMPPRVGESLGLWLHRMKFPTNNLDGGRDESGSRFCIGSTDRRAGGLVVVPPIRSFNQIIFESPPPSRRAPDSWVSLIVKW